MVDRRRKWRAQHQDISIVDSRAGDEYVVSGTTGNEYRVNLSRHHCECKDWQKRSPTGGCKHILHVKMVEGELESLPSAYTNHGLPSDRSSAAYSDEWEQLSRRTKKRDNWECQRCGRQGGPHGHADLNTHHIVPKSKGGEDSTENLITVCESCHESLHGHEIHSKSASPTESNVSEMRGRSRKTQTHSSEKQTTSNAGNASSTTNADASSAGTTGTNTRTQNSDSEKFSQKDTPEYLPGEVHPFDRQSISPAWEGSTTNGQQTGRYTEETETTTDATNQPDEKKSRAGQTEPKLTPFSVIIGLCVLGLVGYGAFLIFRFLMTVFV